MPADPSPEYEQLLEHQLAMNEQTWNALQQHGVVADVTELRLDFLYRAPSRDAAQALATLLQGETDYDINIQSEGSLFRRQWKVVGCTQPTTLSAEVLDQWMHWMVKAGAQHGCAFDGWGAEV